MKAYNNILETIGNTPLVRLSKIEDLHSLKAKIYAKVESFNPAGSVKDRVAYSMIYDAKSKGLINDNSILIEPTSGNTGIGLAMVGSYLGLRVILTMPETMSIERRKLLTAYGAEIVLTPGNLGMNGAIEVANKLNRETPNSIILSQFVNPANPLAHYKNTGKEIYEALDGNVDIFVAGVGTGGTLSGVGKFLKEQNSNIKVVAVEPSNSPVLSKGVRGPHKIQGIGAGFVPATLDTSIYDEILTVDDSEAFKGGKELVRNEGILAGISSGAALHAAIRLASREENAGKVIVVLLPDTGERYLSTTMFED